MWIVFTFISAVTQAITDTLSKHISNKSDEYTLAWARNLFSLPFLWITLFIIGIPKINPQFWFILIIMLPLEVAITFLYFRAIKISPLSASIPFSSFTPIFVALGSLIILKEQLTWPFILAILFLILGAYIMHVEKGGLLKPFIMLAKEKGPLFMLIVAFLWGISTPLGKSATLDSSPYFFVTVFFSLFTLCYTFIFIKRSPNGLFIIKNNLIYFILVGLFNGLFFIFSWLAISLGPTALVNAISMLSIPLTVIFAGAFLRERDLMKRLLASFLMLVGIIIVVLNK